MSDNIIEAIKKDFEITEEIFIEFCKSHGFTFAFRTKITFLKDRLSYYEIKPLGIICTENSEYYFVPLDEEVNIEEIIKEYVKNI